MDIFFIIILVVVSIVGLTFIIERGLALRWKKNIPPEIEAALEYYQTHGDLSALHQACERHPSPLGRLVLTASHHRTWPKAENAEALQSAARREVLQLERGMVILEIIVGIAPLLGLVGTIYGLIMLFGGVSQQSDLSNSNIVANGIALALRATLLGLLTAIPSLVAWSGYSKKVETLTVEMETHCDRLLRRMYRAQSEREAAEDSQFSKVLA